MDLQALQTQLKLVIQNHQIVVSKMRNDPQNLALQKQLHDLQAEIRSLSDKQKQVVEQLRKDLEKKKQQVVLTASTNLSTGYSPVTSTITCSQTQEVRLVCSAQKTNLNHRITTPVQTVALTTKPIPLNSIRQPVPPTVNNIASSAATLAFKAPVGTVVLPNCTTTTALLTSKSADNQKLHPVLVVPSPSSRCGDGPQTGVLVNLMPPIRVPQYPPPTPRPAGQVSPPKSNCMSNSIQPTCINSTSASALTKSPPAAQEKTALQQSAVIPRSPNSSSKLQTVLSSEKLVNKIDQKKKDFMLALGLVTKDSLIEYKNKRMERKRRTTANPQFSNAALEEKWRNAAAAAAAQAASQPLKRPRGRPRLDSKMNATSTNGSQGVVEAASPQENSSTPSTPSLPTNESPNTPTTTVTVVNGMHRRLSPSLETKNVEELLSGLCIVCTQPGDLVKCDSCAKQQHPGCMQPPLQMPPQGKWQCSDCQSRAESLPTVHSYIALRAAKGDEKRKLLKRSLELRLKRSQLEGRLHQLKDFATKQKDRQSELQEAIKVMGTSLETFESVISSVRQCS